MARSGTQSKAQSAKRQSISQWPVDERPREKLLKSGPHTLANSELLAILLRSGVQGESALGLARRIVGKFKTFRAMGQADLSEWKEFKGLGVAKISEIKAAMEIARRYGAEEEHDPRQPLASSAAVVEMFHKRMRALANETVKVVLLDAQHRLIELCECATGSPTGVYPSVRAIIALAVRKNAAGIICLHNHPGGAPAPSKDDHAFTQDLWQAAKLMEIEMLDHIIFGESEWYGFDRAQVHPYPRPDKA